MVCVGSGQQRFKFRDLQSTQDTTNSRIYASKDGLLCRYSETRGPPIFKGLSNELSGLVSLFLATIKPSTNFRYNLAWTYGGFLEDIPQRLGLNRALDTAVQTLVCAHSNICLDREVSTESLRRYSRALSTLASSLNDPTSARSPETLCAVMVLLICQVCAQQAGFNRCTDALTRGLLACPEVGGRVTARVRRAYFGLEATMTQRAISSARSCYRCVARW